MIQRWSVHPLDVWGNYRDGFEVNDVGPSCGVFEIESDAADTVFITRLKRQFLRPQVKTSKITIDWGECTCYVDYCGKPVLELRLLPELSDDKQVGNQVG